jgi:hypothetical protein
MQRWRVIAALLVAACGVVAAFQGMASPNRKGRVVEIKTELPPILADFRDVAEAAGLRAINVSGGLQQKKYLIEATGNGVVIFDIDNDGAMDVLLVNGSTLDGKGLAQPTASHLYRNLGNLRFEDVTQKAKLANSAWGQGACAADYDNDGYTDLFIANYGRSVLYHNEGNGAFRDVTKAMGVMAERTRWDTGCSFFDYDLDGKLDLVVAGYVDFDPGRVPGPGGGDNCKWKGMPVMCGPRGLPHGRTHLFHNSGKSFIDVSVPSGISAATKCYGFTPIASDFDNDGFPDLYVTCDSTASLLFHNRKDGTFEEIGIASGAALNDDGQEQAGMGVAVADFDEDGFPDIVKTNFSDDVPNLYQNNRDGTFSDRVYTSGLGARTQYLGWGVQFLDIDHDGRKDLFMVHGHVYPEVERSALQIRFRQPRLLYWNVGGGKFKDISTVSGAGIAAEWASRGSAAGDLDNDGSLELVVSNMGDRASLLKNFGERKNWLLVQCEGVRSNRSAVGTRVVVFAGGRRVSGEVQTGSSYLSQNDMRLHFGLAGEAAYEKIEVLWPGGHREYFPGGSANRILKIRQGTGSTP